MKKTILLLIMAATGLFVKAQCTASFTYSNSNDPTIPSPTPLRVRFRVIIGILEMAPTGLPIMPRTPTPIMVLIWCA